MKRILSVWRLLPFFFFFSPLVSAFERQLECKVVGISDGDTLTCLYERNPLKVRLQYIDAPESAQPFGNRAKQALSRLAFKQTIRLTVSGYDKYQRLLAVAYLGQRNLNLSLVEQGMAWAYRETQPVYQQAEAFARQKRIGLWQDSHPINPADWRASKRSNNGAILQNSSPSVPLVGTVNCNIKRSCAQFNHYSEALRYFRQCGWQEMDGNGDGIPCNKLYRKAQKR